MAKSCRAAVVIVHTDQTTEFMIAGVEVKMVPMKDSYLSVKSLAVECPDQSVAAAGAVPAWGRAWASRRARPSPSR
jgi:hypothetical protein